MNGPALLSKWVCETEAAIREVFKLAQKFAPAVILFDEIDSIAQSRSAESAQHQVSTVAQLLVLLDGIEERGQVFWSPRPTVPSTWTRLCDALGASTGRCGWGPEMSAGALTHSSTACAG